MVGGLSLPPRLLSRIRQVFLLCRGLGAKKTISFNVNKACNAGQGRGWDSKLEHLLMLLPGRDVGPREPALHAVRRVVNKSQVSGLALPKVPRKSDAGSKNWQAASAA